MYPITSLIVTYNNLAEIGDLLTDLGIHGMDSPVVVIDNASQDGSADLISSQFPRVHLVRNRENVGYARAVNQGVRLCKTAFILLLNPDIRIKESKVISEMLAAINSQDNIAVVAPVQYKEKAKKRLLTFTWSFFSMQGMRLYWEQCIRHKPVEPAAVRVPFLNAGCLMLRKEAFESVGMLNENYFLYGEEPDICLKFRRYNYECRLLPYLSVLHYRERSIARVEPMKRIFVRLRGLGNILHALICGWGCICKDNLAKRGILKRPFLKTQR